MHTHSKDRYQRATGTSTASTVQRCAPLLLLSVAACVFHGWRERNRNKLLLAAMTSNYYHERVASMTTSATRTWCVIRAFYIATMSAHSSHPVICRTLAAAAMKHDNKLILFPVVLSYCLLPLFCAIIVVPAGKRGVLHADRQPHGLRRGLGHGHDAGVGRRKQRVSRGSRPFLLLVLLGVCNTVVC